MKYPTMSAVKMGRAMRRASALREPELVPLEPDPLRGEEDEGLVLRGVNAWNHTVILTGELTHRSAHALEVEIERLCEQGVTDITLDLRDLTWIDPVGVAVIAFRCGLCEKRGYGFRLIRGSHAVQRAFEQAGVIEILPFCDDDTAEAEVSALAHRSLDACER